MLILLSCILILLLSPGCSFYGDQNEKLVHYEELNYDTVSFDIKLPTGRAFYEICKFNGREFIQLNSINEPNIHYLSIDKEENLSVNLHNLETGYQYPDGVYTTNMDSIYLLYARPDKDVLLIDSSGKILNEWNLSGILGEYEIERGSMNPFIVKEGNVYFQISNPDAGERSATGVRKYQSSITVAEVNLSNPVKFNTFGTIPYDAFKVNESSIFSDMYISYTFNELTNSFVVSFTSFPYYFNYDDTYLTKVNEVQSILYPQADKKRDDIKFKDWSKESHLLDHYFSNIGYHRIIHDPYNRLYYRIVTHPADSDTVTFDDNHWSLLVIDEETFELTKEIEFESKMFNYFEAISGENGFYVSANHPESPFFNPNKITFMVFDTGSLTKY